MTKRDCYVIKSEIYNEMYLFCREQNNQLKFYYRNS